MLGAGPTATGPGFVGYLGQADAHPSAYAAVAVWLAPVERLEVFATTPGHGVGRLRPVVAGLAPCAAASTTESGYPLSVGVICPAVTITEPATHELYLALPAVYVLAACGMARAGAWPGAVCAPAADADRRVRLDWPVTAVLFPAVVGVTNADLWGDYSLPAHRYACTAVVC